MNLKTYHLKGTTTSLRARKTVSQGQHSYGGYTPQSCKNLLFAICYGSSSCERNWSAFEMICFEIHQIYFFITNMCYALQFNNSSL